MSKNSMRFGGGVVSKLSPERILDGLVNIPVIAGLTCNRKIGERCRIDAVDLAKKAAFTLSEVLITIGIIGVVAAITLPAVISEIRGQELRAALKKSYSEFSQVLQKMSLDEGSIIANDSNERRIEGFYQKFITYFDGAYDCSKEPARKCISNTIQPNEYKTLDGSSIYTFRFDDGHFRLKDGRMVYIENGDYRFELSVDVNGLYKGPNKWGYDLFTFQVMENGSLVPMGAEGTRSKNCYTTAGHGTENGVGCTYKALNDKDYWKNLKK